MPRDFKPDSKSVQFYNSNFSTMILGFFGDMPYVKLAPVNEKYKGQRAKVNTQMYIYEDSIMMLLNPTEIALLLDSFNDLINNKIPVLEFNHKSKDFISQFNIGYALDGETEELQILISKLEREYPDSDPISEIWFSFPATKISMDEPSKNFYPELTIFKFWLHEAMRLTLGLVVHSNELDPRSFNYENKNKRKIRNNYNDEDEDDEKERKTKRPRRKVSKDNPSDDEDDDDEIPF